MLPQAEPPKDEDSSRVNLIISVVFHVLLVAVVFYFAAREGLLGKKLNKIAVQMIKEKPPEKPKEPPKVEIPKIEPPKVVEVPKVVEAPKVQAPPTVAPTVVAPPNSEMPAFDFGGGKTVETSSDPVYLYKSFIEYTLRSKWHRPTDEADDNFIVEVEVAVDKTGNLSRPVWKKSSGDNRWDDSVKEVLAKVATIDRSPPTNFPPRVTIRFDVTEQTEPVLQ